VVLVGHHRIVLLGLESVLAEAADLEVVAVAADGAEALRHIREHRPDLLLLDARLPRAEAFRILRRARAEGQRPGTLLLADAMTEGDVVRAFAAGIGGILPMDRAAEDLVAALRSLATVGHWHGTHPPIGRWHDRSTILSFAGTAHHAADQSELPALTPREWEVAWCVAEGARNRQIAGALGITESTVKLYVFRIFKKLGVSSRVALAQAMRQGRGG
jgi:DNA-binding NarL/FixJ family response regulator